MPRNLSYARQPHCDRAWPTLFRIGALTASDCLGAGCKRCRQTIYMTRGSGGNRTFPPCLPLTRIRTPGGCGRRPVHYPARRTAPGFEPPEGVDAVGSSPAREEQRGILRFEARLGSDFRANHTPRSDVESG